MNIKAKDLFKDGSELKHKLRSVSDLIRHVKIRESNSDSSNYNLFFGAGCSVTSGIRPASKLIEEWTQELYSRFNRKDCSSLEEAEKYFEKEHSNWYVKENSYSSLFEKNYDLASQRRRFVESEVDGALPSIGYAYLASLVSKKYFNTIFTTNFDDLINEAFYQFSNERPLLCAHDSSIRSISITSKRPKIIKLHGDYLFDDIKSTLRETESLEQNTRNKLIEFCKEFGLIMVGYSGNDRSVMDVLDFLTKQDNYLKSGIYWCLRKDDVVNSTLQNLFWKERVYPVLIDGFDELFAELHGEIFQEGLDFEVNQKNSKLQKIKSEIIKGSNLSNSYIAKDIIKIQDYNSKQEISGFLSELNSNDENQDLSLETFRNLLEIESYSKKGEYSEARHRTERLFNDSFSQEDKSRYATMLITISEKSDEQAECLRWCDKLVSLDVNNYQYIIKKSKYILDFKERYEFLKNKLEFFEYIYFFHNEVALAGFNFLCRYPQEDIVTKEVLLLSLDKSLKLNPSLSNSAWIIKFDILKHYVGLTKDSTGIEAEIDELIEGARKINDNSFDYINLAVKNIIRKEDGDSFGSMLTKLYKIYTSSSISRKERVNYYINDVIKSVFDYEKFFDCKDMAYNFYKSHIIDREIDSDPSILFGKSLFYINYENDIDKAESYFVSGLSCKEIISDFGTAVSLLKCFGDRHLDRMFSILEKNKSGLYRRYYYSFLSDLYVLKNNYEKANENLEMAFKCGYNIKNYYASKSYLLLFFDKNNELLDLYQENKEELEFLDMEVFKINYQYAAKKVNSKNYDEVVLRNIVGNKGVSKNTKLGAFSVLGQNRDVERIINEQVKYFPINYYTYKSWPIIPKDLLNKCSLSQVA